MYNTWEELEEGIKECQKCKLCKTRKNIVFGVREKRCKNNVYRRRSGSGRGYDAASHLLEKHGKLMDKAFQGLGIKREEVYIANIVKCRPPQNRNPEKDEADACIDYLRSQVKLVNPKIIVLLGSVALKNILRRTVWNYSI